ncbi:MAG: hypothetical protein ACI9NT_000080 [Bacteroidia bacterium]
MQCSCSVDAELHTKLEAFESRGEDDYIASHEDIIAIVDGREELLEALDGAPKAMRDFVANRVWELLQLPAFNEAIPGLLPPDNASQARLQLVQGRLQNMAQRV